MTLFPFFILLIMHSLFQQVFTECLPMTGTVLGTVDSKTSEFHGPNTGPTDS